MKKHTVTIVGAGNGGCTIAADLSLKGHKVRLLKTTTIMHNENFAQISNQGGIYIKRGQKEKFAKLNLITKDFQSALDGTEIVMVLTQTKAHERLAPRLTPYLESGQIVLLDPGYGGSLIFSNLTPDRNIIWTEGESLPLDCRITEPGKVNVLSENVRNPLGFFPSNRTAEGILILKELYPSFCSVKNIMEAALHNPNLIVHTIGAIMSIGRIEYSKGEFWMYREAFSPSIWNLVHRLDNEKMNVLEKLGLGKVSFAKSFQFRTYEDQSEDEYKVFNIYAAEGSPKGPTSSKTRYITEDVPMGLCLLSSLGKTLGVKTTICDSLINIASAINQTDYWQEARTLKTLSIDELTADEIKLYLETGEHP